MCKMLAITYYYVGVGDIDSSDYITLIQPFEQKGHAPRRAYLRSPWDEPTFGWGLGSCVLSAAVGKYLTEKSKRLICECIPNTTNIEHDLSCEARIKFEAFCFRSRSTARGIPEWEESKS